MLQRVVQPVLPVTVAAATAVVTGEQVPQSTHLHSHWHWWGGFQGQHDESCGGGVKVAEIPMLIVLVSQSVSKSNHAGCQLVVGWQVTDGLGS